MLSMAEYIWLDGAKPTQALRSKTRVLQLKDQDKGSLTEFPEWGFDGSSTYQSAGHKSDLVLKPVRVVKDPIRGKGNFLVLCEVYDDQGEPHVSNTRATLRRVLEAGGSKTEPWFGFEQEYTLFKHGAPLGWPNRGFPEPQGPFYCGVGSEKVFGRDIVEKHARLCIEADLAIYGTNAEVMPSQWEYQVGYRAVDTDTNDALTFCDHQWLARWLLCTVAEEQGVTVSFSNKPVKGDWNGAGCHTNFSTKAMRDKAEGLAAIQEAAYLLSEKHEDHIIHYGAGLEDRLTGHHETCSMYEFKCGVSDRGASIRIPLQVKQNGYGYLEDRRPGANSDPYKVAARIITTICKIDEELFTGSMTDAEKAARDKISVTTKKMVQDFL